MRSCFLDNQTKKNEKKEEGVPPKWAVWKRQERGWLSKGSNWVLQILQVLRDCLGWEHRIAWKRRESRVLIVFVPRYWRVKEEAASRDAIRYSAKDYRLSTIKRTCGIWLTTFHPFNLTENHVLIRWPAKSLKAERGRS